MRFLLIATGIIVLLAAACKGAGDSLQFHFETSFAAGWENERYWNPDISWQNKYAADADGELLRPLRPKHMGSTTWLVATTDGWHLLQAAQYALYRLAITLLLLVPLSLYRRPGQAVKGLLIFAALWIIQVVGFHLTYTLL